MRKNFPATSVALDQALVLVIHHLQLLLQSLVLFAQFLAELTRLVELFGLGDQLLVQHVEVVLLNSLIALKILHYLLVL